MTGSTLNMHYTIADPKTFGISEYEPVLPIYHSGQPEEGMKNIVQTAKNTVPTCCTGLTV